MESNTINYENVNFMFERMWYADIITKSEPAYSFAICIADDLSMKNRTTLESKLLFRLREKWESDLRNHFSTKLVNNPGIDGVKNTCDTLRNTYKESCVLSQIINNIISDLTE